MPKQIKEEAIRVRAYLLAEADGFQPGREVHYWLQAEKQLAADRPAKATAAKTQSTKSGKSR